MNFQAALLVTLVGIVASAPISDKLDIMNKDTIEQAHSLINKILQDIPTTHAAWIKSKVSIFQDCKHNRYLGTYCPLYSEEQSISMGFSETCLANITKGLQLHFNLLKEISNATTLAQTDQVKDLQAEIHELLLLIEELQNQAGFDPSKQASDEQSQTPEHDLAKHLTNEYLTQVAAHLTLQQLQDFSCDILRSIHSMTSSLAENPNTVQLCVNKAGL
uniref:Colony stimulating factor 3 (granulocyte) a n=1 Tax=Cyprinus carpio TaxID=7962 RepID=A0A8C2BK98_CYPCA